MRRVIPAFVLFCLLVLTGGCTLSVEEWIESEEEKGYDDVVTVENEFYKLSYEYKETTRSLTESIQEYIASVDMDSVLYFLDNIPSDWIPDVGGCVVATCCERFPMGLIRRVTSIEKTSGLIKVVTEEAGIEDAYDEFNLDLDLNVIAGPDSLRTTRVNTRAGVNGEPDSVQIDWTMYRMLSDGGDVATRSFDDDYKRDVDDEKESTVTITIAKFDASSPIIEPLMKKWTKNVINQFEVSVNSVSKTHIKKVVKLRDRSDYTETTNTNGIGLSVLVGHDFAKLSDEKNAELLAGRQKQFTDWLSKAGAAEAYYDEKMSLLDQLNLVVEIPLPPLPFGIVARAKPVLDINMGLYGAGNFTFWTSKSKSVTHYRNDKLIEDRTVELPTPKNEYDVSIGGSFKVSGGAEFFVGVGTVVGPGSLAAVGAFAKYTGNFEAKLRASLLDDGVINANSDNIISIYGEIEAGGKVLGGHFLELPVFTKTAELGKREISYYPQLEMQPSFKSIIDYDKEGGYRQFTVQYKFSELGIHLSGVWFMRNLPILRLYKNDEPLGSKNFEDITPDGKVTSIKTNTLYTFTYKTRDMYDEYTVVPGVKDVNGDVLLFSDYTRTVTKDEKPIVKYALSEHDSQKYYDILYQTKGEIFDHNGYADASVPMSLEEYYMYEFTLPFYMFNAATIPGFWDDWGIEYDVGVSGTNIWYEGHKSLMRYVSQSGNYAVKIRFALNRQPSFGREIYANAHLYYVEKGDAGKTRKWLMGNSAKQYLYEVYKLSKQETGDKWVNNNVGFVYPYEPVTYNWQKHKNTNISFNLTK